MRIADLLKRGTPTVSFEFFPPKTDTGRDALLRAIDRLRQISPDFVSVTYGAGGSTRELSFELCKTVRKHVQGEVMSHLTSMCHSGAEIDEIAQLLWEAGIVNIMALRGDKPKALADTEIFNEFGYAKDMMAFLTARHRFCLGGACYPEGHKETPDIDKGIEHLQQKIDGGCEFLVTQMFFDNAAYFRFVDRARQAGIGVPIVPGIMPITGFAQIDKFENQFGVRLPAALRDEVLAHDGDEDAITEIGIAWSARQCRELLDGCAPGLHFYTLNRSAATLKVCLALGVSGSPAVRLEG